MRRPVFLVALLLLVTLVLAACSTTSDVGTPSGSVRAFVQSPAAVPSDSAPAAVADTPARTPEPRFAPEPPAAWDGDTVGAAELPPEALQTLLLIADGGPFPYDQDGATFQNREGILPDEPDGYYAEYTVETPGSADRGARRLVVGDDWYVYYTDDHYDSFRFVTG
jgi:ribonuclease T1